MNKNAWIISPILLLLLTSCGQQVASVYDRSTYHTNVFEDNMYQDTFLSTIQPEVGLSITYTLFENQVVTGIGSLREDDLGLENDVPTTDENFAQQYKLSKTIPSLSYGFESKLFDGILYCTDAVRLSKSRLQLNPSGMGYPLQKKLTTYDYTGVFMKAGADTNAGAAKITDLNVILTYYVADEEFTWIAHRFKYPVSNLRQSDYPQFYGFYFDETELAVNALVNAEAFSFEYEILNEEAQNSPENLTGIFLYEVLLPNATWSHS